MTESQFIIILTSILSLVMSSLCIVLWAMFRDNQKKLSEIVLVVNDHSTELAVAKEQIENNRAKIERHDRLISNEFQNELADKISVKLAIMKSL